VDLRLSEEQKMLKAMIKQLVDEKIVPRAAEFGESDESFWEQVAILKENNLFGIFIPKEYGGEGLDTVSQSIIMEELARGSVSTSATLMAHGLGLYPILDFGSEEQKQKYLPPLAKGEKLCAYGETEPAGGSDVDLIETTAVKDGNHYVLNGTKIFCTNGGEAETYTVFASTDRSKGARGLSTFIVEKGMPGFSFGKKYNKMGIRGSVTSELFLDDCRVPEENLIGELEQGFNHIVTALSESRIMVAAQGVGVAEAAFIEAAKYAKQRVQYGQVIAKHQGIEWWFADMHTEITAARLLVYNAALAKDQGAPFIKETAMAKMYTSEVARRVCNKALQVFGGHGYMKDLPLERYYRDQRILEIYEGTSEIMRMMIGRQALREIAV